MRILRHHGREQVGLAISLLAGIITLFNLVELLGGKGSGSLTPVIVPGAVTIIVFFTVRIESIASYWLQCGVLAAVALLLALLGEGYQPLAAVLLALALAMVLQYRLVSYSFGFLIAALVLTLPFFIVGGIMNHSLASSVMLSVAIFTFTLVVWRLFGAELRQAEYRANKAEAMAQLAISTLQAGHEARARLSVIRSLSLRIREHPADGQLIKMVAENSDRLEAHLKSMMEYSRASANLLKEPCEIGTVVHSVVWICSCLPQFRHLVRFVETIEVVWLELAPLDFRMAVDNLVQNAAESVFATGKVGAVRVSCTSQRLVVEDDGQGVQTCNGCTGADCLECAAFQAGKTSKRGGTGMGVLQVRDFCRAHSYGLSYQRLESGGTRVTMDFAPTAEGGADERN